MCSWDVLAQVRDAFVNKKEFETLFNQRYMDQCTFTQALNNLKNIHLIDEDFKNCQFTGKITQGKFKYMKVETHTTKKDIKERVEKLGDRGTIITKKVDEDGNTYLIVGKVYKY